MSLHFDCGNVDIKRGGTWSKRDVTFWSIFRGILEFLVIITTVDIK